jgi:hypothetical protein
VGTAGLGDSNIAAGIVVVPFVADSGRGSSHETHLDLAASLLTMQTPHVHEPTGFVGSFIPAASQLKPVEAGFAPKMNGKVGREDESATKATLRSLAWFGTGLRSVVTLNENDGRDAVSRRRAACFGSLGVNFVECGAELGPASGRELVTGVGGVGRLGIAAGFGGGSEKGTLGRPGASAGVSNADLAGGDSGSLSAAKPKRSFDGSFGADDLSGNGALVVPPNRVPFTTGAVFLALG